MTEIIQVKEPLTMFHYLLEMHKDGKSLKRMELNVPIAGFPAVRMHEFLALEALLLEYGKSQGYTKELAQACNQQQEETTQ